MRTGFLNFDSDFPFNEFIKESNGKYKKDMSIPVMISAGPDDSYDGMSIVSILDNVDVGWVGQYGDDHTEHYFKGMQFVVNDAMMYDELHPILTDYARFDTLNQADFENSILSAWQDRDGKAGDWSIISYIDAKGKDDSSPCDITMFVNKKTAEFGVVICDDQVHADPTRCFMVTAGYVANTLDWADEHSLPTKIFDEPMAESVKCREFIPNVDGAGNAVSSNGFWNLKDGADFGNGLHYTRSMSIPVEINGYNGNPELCHIVMHDNYDIPLRGKYQDDHRQHVMNGDEYIIDMSEVTPKPLYDVLEPVSAGKAKLNRHMAKMDGNDGFDGVTGPDVTD